MKVKIANTVDLREAIFAAIYQLEDEIHKADLAGKEAPTEVEWAEKILEEVWSAPGRFHQPLRGDWVRAFTEAAEKVSERHTGDIWGANLIRRQVLQKDIELRPVVLRVMPAPNLVTSVDTEEPCPRQD